MTDYEINIEIAEHLGFKEISKSAFRGEIVTWGRLEEITRPIPDYCNDLNAMYEVMQSLSGFQRVYLNNLCQVANIDGAEVRSHSGTYYLLNATARQRAEAFLRTVGKWDEQC